MIHAMTKSMNARERSEREVEIGNASGGGVGEAAASWLIMHLVQVAGPNESTHSY